MNSAIATAAAALLLTASASHVYGENSTSIAGYTIHHSAFTTDFLSPQVARAYQVQRSKSRALLNVAVIKESPGTTGEAVAAEVRATARNLIGQSREIPLREVREGDAIYYIGEFGVTNEETLLFTLDVTPAGSERHFSAELSQQFYTY